MTAATCLWFAPDVAPRAVDLYARVVPGFRTLAHRHLDQPEGPGSDVWELEFSGTPYQVMGADHAPAHTMAASVSLRVDDQEQLDAFWDAVLAAGGRELACGWVVDPFGVHWQVLPRVFVEAMTDGQPATAQRVAEALWTMTRPDVAVLEQAAQASAR